MAMAQPGAPGWDSSPPGSLGSVQRMLNKGLCPDPGGHPILLIRPWGGMQLHMGGQWRWSLGRCRSTGCISPALHPGVQPSLA